MRSTLTQYTTIINHDVLNKICQDKILSVFLLSDLLMSHRRPVFIGILKPSKTPYLLIKIGQLRKTRLNASYLIPIEKKGYQGEKRDTLIQNCKNLLHYESYQYHFHVTLHKYVVKYNIYFEGVKSKNKYQDSGLFKIIRNSKKRKLSNIVKRAHSIRYWNRYYSHNDHLKNPKILKLFTKLKLNILMKVDQEMIVVSMTFGYNLLTTCLFPLHNDFEFINLCCDTSERSNKLNNAVG
ncbi:hypothetical protein AGLY_008165 [Aphis glycines]|uniref:Uncharacterized protein n=1 Tax=Aphis glycines TaxID=307491 RepID=A0A6G0TMB5_APHGL|nr:hypothetical protein AGLY_008165 [Aphis glycines]